MIRSASFLPIPGIDDEDGLVLGMIASWRSGVGRDADDRQGDLRARRPLTVSSSVKNPSSSAVRKPYRACWSSRTRWYVWSFSRPPGTAEARIAGAANTR